MIMGTTIGFNLVKNHPLGKVRKGIVIRLMLVKKDWGVVGWMKVIIRVEMMVLIMILNLNPSFHFSLLKQQPIKSRTQRLTLV